MQRQLLVSRMWDHKNHFLLHIQNTLSIYCIQGTHRNPDEVGILLPTDDGTETESSNLLEVTPWLAVGTVVMPGCRPLSFKSKTCRSNLYSLLFL